MDASSSPLRETLRWIQSIPEDASLIYGIDGIMKENDPHKQNSVHDRPSSMVNLLSWSNGSDVDSTDKDTMRTSFSGSDLKSISILNASNNVSKDLSSDMKYFFDPSPTNSPDRSSRKTTIPSSPLPVSAIDIMSNAVMKDQDKLSMLFDIWKRKFQAYQSMRCHYSIWKELIEGYCDRKVFHTADLHYQKRSLQLYTRRWMLITKAKLQDQTLSSVVMLWRNYFKQFAFMKRFRRHHTILRYRSPYKVKLELFLLNKSLRRLSISLKCWRIKTHCDRRCKRKALYRWKGLYFLIKWLRKYRLLILKHTFEKLKRRSKWPLVIPMAEKQGKRRSLRRFRTVHLMRLKAIQSEVIALRYHWRSLWHQFIKCFESYRDRRKAFQSNLSLGISCNRRMVWKRFHRRVLYIIHASKSKHMAYKSQYYPSFRKLYSRMYHSMQYHKAIGYSKSSRLRWPFLRLNRWVQSSQQLRSSIVIASRHYSKACKASSFHVFVARLLRRMSIRTTDRQSVRYHRKRSVRQIFMTLRLHSINQSNQNKSYHSMTTLNGSSNRLQKAFDRWKGRIPVLRQCHRSLDLGNRIGRHKSYLSRWISWHRLQQRYRYDSRYNSRMIRMNCPKGRSHFKGKYFHQIISLISQSIRRRKTRLDGQSIDRYFHQNRLQYCLLLWRYRTARSLKQFRLMRYSLMMKYLRIWLRRTTDRNTLILSRYRGSLRYTMNSYLRGLQALARNHSHRVTRRRGYRLYRKRHIHPLFSTYRKTFLYWKLGYRIRQGRRDQLMRYYRHRSYRMVLDRWEGLYFLRRGLRRHISHWKKRYYDIKTDWQHVQLHYNHRHHNRRERYPLHDLRVLISQPRIAPYPIRDGHHSHSDLIRGASNDLNPLPSYRIARTAHNYVSFLTKAINSSPSYQSFAKVGYLRRCFYQWHRHSQSYRSMRLNHQKKYLQAITKATTCGKLIYSHQMKYLHRIYSLWRDIYVYRRDRLRGILMQSLGRNYFNKMKGIYRSRLIDRHILRQSRSFHRKDKAIANSDVFNRRQTDKSLLNRSSRSISVDRSHGKAVSASLSIDKGANILRSNLEGHKSFDGKILTIKAHHRDSTTSKRRSRSVFDLQADAHRKDIDKSSSHGNTVTDRTIDGDNRKIPPISDDSDLVIGRSMASSYKNIHNDKVRTNGLPPSKQDKTPQSSISLPHSMSSYNIDSVYPKQSDHLPLDETNPSNGSDSSIRNHRSSLSHGISLFLSSSIILSSHPRQSSQKDDERDGNKLKPVEGLQSSRTNRSMTNESIDKDINRSKFPTNDASDENRPNSQSLDLSQPSHPIASKDISQSQRLLNRPSNSDSLVHRHRSSHGKSHNISLSQSFDMSQLSDDAHSTEYLSSSSNSSRSASDTRANSAIDDKLTQNIPYSDKASQQLDPWPMKESEGDSSISYPNPAIESTRNSLSISQSKEIPRSQQISLQPSNGDITMIPSSDNPSIMNMQSNDGNRFKGYDRDPSMENVSRNPSISLDPCRSDSSISLSLSRSRNSTLNHMMQNLVDIIMSDNDEDDEALSDDSLSLETPNPSRTSKESLTIDQSDDMKSRSSVRGDTIASKPILSKSLSNRIQNSLQSQSKSKDTSMISNAKALVASKASNAAHNGESSHFAATSDIKTKKAVKDSSIIDRGKSKGRVDIAVLNTSKSDRSHSTDTRRSLTSRSSISSNKGESESKAPIRSRERDVPMISQRESALSRSKRKTLNTSKQATESLEETANNSYVSIYAKKRQSEGADKPAFR